VPPGWIRRWRYVRSNGKSTAEAAVDSRGLIVTEMQLELVPRTNSGARARVSDKGAGLIAEMLREPIRVSLIEQTRQAERPMTDWDRESLAKGWRTTKPYDLVPSGALTLRSGEATSRDKRRNGSWLAGTGWTQVSWARQQ
jgi:hypothetical protein